MNNNDKYLNKLFQKSLKKALGNEPLKISGASFTYRYDFETGSFQIINPSQTLNGVGITLLISCILDIPKHFLEDLLDQFVKEHKDGNP